MCGQRPVVCFPAVLLPCVISNTYQIDISRPDTLTATEPEAVVYRVPAAIHVPAALQPVVTPTMTPPAAHPVAAAPLAELVDILGLLRKTVIRKCEPQHQFY
ncbi:hypothetical protein [Paraburkholderia sp. JPY419]|uniref:hypothetical protein n=1 Tax=Paraburkholderia sp. JPY419 TaxID=667660 RepID=UPI003D1DE0A7